MAERQLPEQPKSGHDFKKISVLHSLGLMPVGESLLSADQYNRICFLFTKLLKASGNSFEKHCVPLNSVNKSPI